MANSKTKDDNDLDFSFLPDKHLFGTDNCATHHVCNDRSLFVGEIPSLSNVGIRGIGGVAAAAGIGTINFSLTSEDGHKDDIILNNVIYQPDCPKNLLSNTRWSKDRGNNAGVFSMGAILYLPMG